MDEFSVTPQENPTIIDDFLLVDSPKRYSALLYDDDDDDGILSKIENEYFGIPKTPKETDGSSRQNQVTSLSFGLKPAKKMKLAIEALADSDFNPEGLARIDVDKLGFEIAVHNARSGVCGCLLLKPDGLIDYNCTKPVRGKGINLVEFSNNLNAVHDEATISIYLLDGSNELAVKFDKLNAVECVDDEGFTLVNNFGMTPSQDFTVELVETTAVCDRVLRLEKYCKALLEPKDLREMIGVCQEEVEPQQVVADFTQQAALYLIREKNKAWVLHSKQDKRCTNGIEKGQKYLVDFALHHVNSVKKAASLIEDSSVTLSILKDPPKHIMLCFYISIHEFLLYVMKAKPKVFQVRETKLV